MRLKLMTLRYSSTLGGFDETPLERFVANKEVLSFKEHFFLVNEVPHLLCVLTWRALACDASNDPGSGSSRLSASSHRKNGRSRPDPCSDLDERQRHQFETLREWRRTKAQHEGVPPYVLLTNKELVAIIRAAPESLTALGHVEGIGKSKLERHGSEILAKLADGVPADDAAAPEVAS